MMDWLEQPLNYWRSGGPLLVPIACVSLGIWAYFIRSRQKLLGIVRESRQVEQLITGMSGHAGAAEVAEAVSRRRGALAGLFGAVMQDVLAGARPLKAFERREDEGLHALRKDLVVLAALTAIAPLLGLLGTVVGMIETFEAVSAVGGNTGGRVASGISQALITTQFGLVVAVPGIFGVAHLRRLLSHVQVRIADCRMHVVALLERPQGGVAS
ncbi:MAG TPA: MotA/TolQ/ExbB proton channel family protein [Sedimentisphaerales bacterium]|nr:MotA/TolQ/ExbB proton channel family protein [Sedimentisphaerales bacterium]